MFNVTLKVFGGVQVMDRHRPHQREAHFVHVRHCHAERRKALPLLLTILESFKALFISNLKKKKLDNTGTINAKQAHTQRLALQ